MNLEVINKDGLMVLDSRDVAEMVGKRHTDLMRSINGYVSILENAEMRSQDFFISHSYKVDGNNKTYECYLLTRKGCDMVANKMTGEKGILFTATYVTKFEEMENQLKSQVALHSYMIDDPIKRAEKWIEEQKEKQQIQQQLMITEPKANKYDEFLNADGYLTGEKAAKVLNIGRNTLYKFLRDNSIWTNDNIPYQRFINQGLFKVVTKTIIGVGVTEVTLFTTKGVDYVADKLKNNK